MLSQDEQRRLAAIEAGIREEDELFADSLRLGHPRCPRGDQRWPFQALLAFGGLLFMLGLNNATVSLIAFGGAVALIGWRGDRRRRINRHRRPLRRRLT